MRAENQPGTRRSRRLIGPLIICIASIVCGYGCEPRLPEDALLDDECRESDDCAGGQECLAGRCVPRDSGLACGAQVGPIVSADRSDAPDFALRGVCRGQVHMVCDAESGQFVMPRTLADIGTQDIDGFQPDEVSFDCRDNDCDGQVDEDGTEPAPARSGELMWRQGPCATLTRICDGSILRDLDENEIGAIVDGFEPHGEVTCGDGIDNDCDGMIDEGLATGAPCYDGAPATAFEAPAICRMGTYQCVDGRSVCAGLIEPAEAEICSNLVDEDCDGRVDEYCVGGPCESDDACPETVDIEGVPVRVRCVESLPGGMCVMDCNCIPCRECRVFNPDEPPEFCAEECARCDQVDAYCQAQGGLCISVRPEGAANSFEACVRDCDMFRGECRDGYECGVVATLDGERWACYPETPEE